MKFNRVPPSFCRCALPPVPLWDWKIPRIGGLRTGSLFQVDFYGQKRRPTGREPHVSTAPALWVVRSTGWFGPTLSSLSSQALRSLRRLQEALHLFPRGSGSLGMVADG